MPTTALPYASPEEYREGVANAAAAAQAYYTSGDVLMDDASYDTLLDRLRVTEGANPAWRVSDSPVGKVGSPDLAASTTVAHSSPMLSLDNVFSVEDLGRWSHKLNRHLPQLPARYVVELKFDGLALAARYEAGRLVQLLTRGDGEHGEDISHAIGSIVGLPTELTEPVTIEVRGEVVLTREQFELANEARLAHGDTPFANERNGVAGALRGKNRDYTIEMTFYAYGLGDDSAFESHSDALAYAGTLGVATTWGAPAGLALCSDIEQVAARVVDIATSRDRLPFRVDGAVIKADMRADRIAAGFSSRAPRWAIAYKYPADTAVSTLLEVQWEVGRTGIIAPRARIEPVFVDGTMVEYATLHNPSDILRKGFLLGDSVSVCRAGEVIPRLEAPLPHLRTGAEVPIEMPSTCPRCDAEIDKSGARWRCVRGRACALQENIEYAVSRDCLDIEGLGPKIVRQLVDRQIVADVADVFTLDLPTLVSLDRMGEANATKILDEIERARSARLNRVFCALGIRGTGRSMSRRLTSHFTTMRALQDASVDDLIAVPGIGAEKAPVIVAELADLRPVIDKLAAAGVNLGEEVAAGGQGGAGESGSASGSEPAALPFAGKSVCVSGTVPGLTRTEAQEAVEALGGRAASSVSKNTDVLVAGAGAGSKLAKAEALGVAVMAAEEFAALYAAARS